MKKIIQIKKFARDRIYQISILLFCQIVLPFIFFSADLKAQFNCQREADSLFKKVVQVIGLTQKRESVDEELAQLNKLYQKKCFDPRALKASEDQVRPLVQVYFDPLTMQPSLFTTTRNEKIKKALVDSKLNPPTCLSQQGNILKKLPPVRDQKSTGWCQYQALADLYSVATGRFISAAYLGVLLSPSGRGGSPTVSANALIEKYGLCTEEKFRSPELPERYENFGEWLSNFQARMLAQLNLENSSKDGESLLCSYYFDIQKMLGAMSFGDLLSILGKSLDKRGYPKSTEIPFNEIFSVPTTLFAHVVLNWCEQDRKAILAKPKLKSYMEDVLYNVPRTHEILQDNLSRGLPVAISYNYYTLTNSYKTEGEHVSLVVDQRMIDGRCQYLVRNSWGPGSCTRIVPQKDACEPGGYFWVDAGELALETNDLIVLD
jgi:hypothetical protein